jgi:hypothetical protein
MAEVPSVAVVIDVMRAFTVTAWAFAQGAEKVVLAGSLEEALSGLPGLHADDVALCLEVDRFPFAMVVTLEDPLVVLRPCLIGAAG